MEINKINHISINIEDITKALKFYHEILGFQVLEKMNNGDNDVIYLDMGNGNRLELFDYHGKNNKVERLESALGYRHLALEVNSVDDWYLYLKNKDVNIVLEPTDLSHLKVRVCLFEDFDGNVLEICKSI